MAKLGEVLARWSLEAQRPGEFQTFDRDRTEYAVRKDGVLLKKLCGHRPPDAYSKGGWHDWGWKIASRRGKKDVMAEIERVDYLLKSRGFVRVRS